MDDLASSHKAVAPKRLVAYAAAAVVAIALGGYAIQERSTAAELAAANAQQNATINATQHQLSDLATRVNELAAVNAAQASLAPAAPAAVRTPGSSRPSTKPRARVDSRYKKLQAQLEAQS